VKQTHLRWRPVARTAALLTAVGLLASCSSAAKPDTTAAQSEATLACAAQITTRHISADSVIKMHVHTVPGATVTASGPVALVHGEHPGTAANAAGDRAIRPRLDGAVPGLSYVTVSVVLGARHGACTAALTVPAPPASPSPSPAPAPSPSSAPAPSPSPTSAPPTPAPPTSAPPAATSCYPISDEGTCYEPGEFCRDDDHGMTGLAGDGETITCEDNDGWRWEPT
jgi:hypothetical protein